MLPRILNESSVAESAAMNSGVNGFLQCDEKKELCQNIWYEKVTE